MLNFVSASKASLEMIPASSANPFGASSPVPGASPDFASALHGAWAGHSNSQSPEGGRSSPTLRPFRSASTGNEKEQGASSYPSNQLPSAGNPSTGNISAPAPPAPEPFDSVASNSSNTSTSPLRAVAGDIASAALSLVGVPTFLANSLGGAVVNTIAGILTSTKQQGNDDSGASVSAANAQPAPAEDTSPGPASQSQFAGKLDTAELPSGEPSPIPTPKRIDAIEMFSTAVANSLSRQGTDPSPKAPEANISVPSPSKPAAPPQAPVQLLAPSLPQPATPPNSTLSGTLGPGRLAANQNSATIGTNSQATAAQAQQSIAQELAGHLQSALESESSRSGAVAGTTNSSVHASGLPIATTAVNGNPGGGSHDASKQSSGSASDSATDSGSSSGNGNRCDTNVENANAKNNCTQTVAAVTASATSQNPASNGASAQSTAAAVPIAPNQPAETSAKASAPPAPAPSAPPQPFSLPQALPGSLNDVVKASELYQHVGGAEMRIAMQTDLLGTIDLRATLHQSALTATIGVQRGDVQAILSNDLPSLQHALSDKSLRIDQISVMNNSVGGGLDLGGQRQPQAQPQAQASAPRGEYALSGGPGQSSAVAMAESLVESSPLGRLNIHV